VQPQVNVPSHSFPSFLDIDQDVDEHKMVFDFNAAWLPCEIEIAGWNCWNIGAVTTSRTMRWQALSRDSEDLLEHLPLNESQAKQSILL
jgi:hypothetical protein